MCNYESLSKSDKKLLDRKLTDDIYRKSRQYHLPISYLNKFDVDNQSCYMQDLWYWKDVHDLTSLKQYIYQKYSIVTILCTFIPCNEEIHRFVVDVKHMFMIDLIGGNDDYKRRFLSISIEELPHDMQKNPSLYGYSGSIYFPIIRFIGCDCIPKTIKETIRRIKKYKKYI